MADVDITKAAGNKRRRQRRRTRDSNINCILNDLLVEILVKLPPNPSSGAVAFERHGTA